MRKVLFGLIVTAVFFYLGRRDESTVIDQTATHWIQKVAAPLFQKTFQQQNLPERQASQPKSAEEKLLSSVDTELFDQVYSQDFAQNWNRYLPIVKQRLFSQLPDPTKDTDNYEKEVVARLGILKSFNSISTTENNSDLKNFLFEYLETTERQSWTLKREALHTLHTQNDLTEEEQQRSIKFADAQARNTASYSDRELLKRSIEGER